jgi:predicted enzyme related to lactoylglutathione lyase
MKKVTGIGGIFFKTADPKAMKEWYAKNLGLPVADYGTMFNWRHNDDPEKTGSTVWSPFAADTKYFEPSTKDLMINYLVEDIEALVEQLKADGVTVLDDIATYEYGKFVHIMDPDGNKIELWEPAAE